jgi:hypothetical protein
MKSTMIIVVAVLVEAAGLGIGCRSQAASREPDDVNETIDKAVAMGADIPPARRGLVGRMLRLNEKDLLLGLRTYADLSGGRYPTRLDTESTLKEIEANRLGADLTDVPKDQKDRMLKDIFFATAFYDKLVREKRGAQYHGDSVTGHDGDKVLISWMEPKQQYRVVPPSSSHGSRRHPDMEPFQVEAYEAGPFRPALSLRGWKHVLRPLTRVLTIHEFDGRYLRSVERVSSCCRCERQFCCPSSCVWLPLSDWARNTARRTAASPAMK